MDITLPEFLAHAIALEAEAAERYLELADMMESYGKADVAALFREMVGYSRLHHDAIVERAQGVALPQLRSWQYRWRQPPEAGGDEAFDRHLSAYDALRYARENEFRAQAWYSQVHDAASAGDVRSLAGAFAAEEAEHVQALDAWLARTPRPSMAWRIDPYHEA
ncbi:MAG: rubrerythrin [Rubrivivax sp.]|nr:rubrerythrin [Rubrivivax sp.]